MLPSEPKDVRLLKFHFVKEMLFLILSTDQKSHDVLKYKKGDIDTKL